MNALLVSAHNVTITMFMFTSFIFSRLFIRPARERENIVRVLVVDLVVFDGYQLIKLQLNSCRLNDLPNDLKLLLLLLLLLELMLFVWFVCYSIH